MRPDAWVDDEQKRGSRLVLPTKEQSRRLAPRGAGWRLTKRASGPTTSASKGVLPLSAGAGPTHRPGPGGRGRGGQHVTIRRHGAPWRPCPTCWGSAGSWCRWSGRKGRGCGVRAPGAIRSPRPSTRTGDCPRRPTRMKRESSPLTWWTSRRRRALPQGLASRPAGPTPARGRRSRKDPEVGQGAERPSPGQPRRPARGPPGLRRRPRDDRRDARSHHASSGPPGEARAGISRRLVLVRSESKSRPARDARSSRKQERLSAQREPDAETGRP